MNVLVAMSGGVDSSVAAALLRDEGHDVVGVTLKLWGGDSDSGCCSVSDVDDARRVAHQLRIEHLVFNFSEDFDRNVVEPYVHDHSVGLTPNPCIECNRHLKFDRLFVRAEALGFDAVATGHHAQIVQTADGKRIGRGADHDKDQSYVIHMMSTEQIEKLLLPIGHLRKEEVRARAAELGLRTAQKPDSQDVCFITRAGGGRKVFLGDRIPMHPGRVIDKSGQQLGSVEAVEMVTLGQRRGFGIGIDGKPRFAIDVDVPNRTVVVGEVDDLDVRSETLHTVTWADALAREKAQSQTLVAQASAHGDPIPVEKIEIEGENVIVTWAQPHRRIAPGQSVVFYCDDVVVGGGIVARPRSLEA